MLNLYSDVQFIKGVGPRRAALLGSHGIHNVHDLLLWIPRGYQDRTQFAPLDTLKIGVVHTCKAKIYALRMIPTRSKGRILDLILTDGTSFIHAKWFNGEHLYHNGVFSIGRELVLFGRAETDRYDQGLVFFNPEFELVSDGEDTDLMGGGHYVAVYAAIAGISSRQFRKIIYSALDRLPNEIVDPLPDHIIDCYKLPTLQLALNRIHRPTLDDDIDELNTRCSRYHRRFIFEEFLLLELTLAVRRHHLRTNDGIRFQTDASMREKVKQILPFHPTQSQKYALKEILNDLKSRYPMNRLLQGDVGCGKTIVAFEAVVIAVENGFQAAMMVPTEILAEQHYINARKILQPLGYSIGLLKRTLPKRRKLELLEKIAASKVQVVIGTHALLENASAFGKLGLVIIDEQHRFGVMQRLRLMEKGRHPNTLVMTATPIPRSLAMTFYGDLDVSVIDEIPPGRVPVDTFYFTDEARKQIYKMLEDEMSAGRQCYVVYPLIEESEKLDLKSANEGYEKLCRAFPNRNLALLHGRMKSEEKESVMAKFAAGKIDAMVSTTVIEVGVDVPNATLMLIEHAERFGIAQLHQLRGRVGRGTHASKCVLTTPNRISETAQHRIQAVRATTDGFHLAEVDLKIRGPGELTGTRQSGIPEFRFADLVEDVDLLLHAREEAGRLAQDVGQRDILIADLSRRYGPQDLAKVG